MLIKTTCSVYCALSACAVRLHSHVCIYVDGLVCGILEVAECHLWTQQHFAMAAYKLATKTPQKLLTDGLHPGSVRGSIHVTALMSNYMRIALVADIDFYSLQSRQLLLVIHNVYRQYRQRLQPPAKIYCLLPTATPGCCYAAVWLHP